MKKKTIFKLLPALLIAPILACCITLYANASEAEEGQTIFEQINYHIYNFYNSIFSTANINDYNQNADINSLEGTDVSYTLNSDDNLFMFDVIDGTDEAIISGWGGAWYMPGEPKTELVIPTKVTDISSKQTYRVTSIKANSFTHNSYLDSIGNTISSITIKGWENGDGGWFKEIGSESFNGYFENFQYVDGYKEFYGGSLKTIKLPSCTKSLGFSAFNSDAALENIYSVDEYGNETKGLPSALTSIGDNTFADCSSVKYDDGLLTIPDGVTTIDVSCFHQNFGITKVVFNRNLESTGEEGSPMGTKVFYRCKNLTEVDFTNLNNSTKFLAIEAQCFSLCKNLNNITFPTNSSLKIIGEMCFNECSSLNHIKLVDTITIIRGRAFCNCCSLSNIELVEGLERIEEYCFSMTNENATKAASLEYIKIPESVKFINEGAFQNNSTVKEIVVGMQNANEATIADGAFSNLPNLISVTFLWNVPRQINIGCFNVSKSPAFCGNTPDIDIRFRPLSKDSDYGGRGTDATKDGNYWLKIEEAKRWDDIAPADSRLMLIAAFDNDAYGNDLKTYLNESTGKFDNASFEKLNKGECPYDGTTHEALKNGVHYTVCITIPDVLKFEKTTNTTLKTYAKTATPEGSKDVLAGERSKGIEFIYDDTNVHQITHKGKELNRPADDGVLVINNNAIQVNSNNTLYVKYRSKKGEKSNPCVWGHSAGNSNPFQNTYDYLTADANQMDSLGQDKNSNSNPVILNNEPEDEIINENKPLFLSFGGGESDVTIPNACCFFSKPGGTVEDKTYEDAKLIITDNVTFGGKWTDNSLPDDERTDVDVGNTCHLGCVYNDGDLTMTDCTFQNSTGTWSGKTQKGDSYGGSCLFNYRDAKVTNCLMNNCSAKYDGGAVMNAGSLEMISCTISNCSSVRYGGAIFSNLGDTSRGAEGATALIVTGCTLTNNQSGTGGAIHYWNGSTLELGGTLTFSGNTDSNGTSDIFISNIYESKNVQPFTLGTAFKATNKITLCAKQAKNGMVVCSSGASAVDSFTYQKDAFVLEADDSSNIILKTLYTLAIAEDGTGSWIDEEGNTVTSFTLGVATAPQVVDDKITYKDTAGVTHELTATPAEGYEFTSCKFDESTHTYTATFTTVEQLTNRAKNFTNAIKENINKRNADPKENKKVELAYER